MPLPPQRQALRTTVKDRELPLPSGVLWNAHVLPARPAGSTLDLKASSFRKWARYLEAQAGCVACGLAHFP